MVSHHRALTVVVSLSTAIPEKGYIAGKAVQKNGLSSEGSNARDAGNYMQSYQTALSPINTMTQR